MATVAATEAAAASLGLRGSSLTQKRGRVHHPFFLKIVSIWHIYAEFTYGYWMKEPV
ncbi:hypothetical protein ACJX0J_032356, partial [Zea mays]